MIRLGMTNPALPGPSGKRRPKRRPGDGNREIQDILRRIRRKKPSKSVKRPSGTRVPKPQNLKSVRRT